MIINRVEIMVTKLKCRYIPESIPRYISRDMSWQIVALRADGKGPEPFLLLRSEGQRRGESGSCRPLTTLSVSSHIGYLLPFHEHPWHGPCLVRTEPWPTGSRRSPSAIPPDIHRVLEGSTIIRVTDDISKRRRLAHVDRSHEIVKLIIKDETSSIWQSI